MINLKLEGLKIYLRKKNTEKCKIEGVKVIIMNKLELKVTFFHRNYGCTIF